MASTSEPAAPMPGRLMSGVPACSASTGHDLMHHHRPSLSEMNAVTDGSVSQKLRRDIPGEVRSDTTTGVAESSVCHRSSSTISSGHFVLQLTSWTEAGQFAGR